MLSSLNQLNLKPIFHSQVRVSGSRQDCPTKSQPSAQPSHSRWVQGEDPILAKLASQTKVSNYAWRQTWTHFKKTWYHIWEIALLLPPRELSARSGLSLVLGRESEYICVMTSHYHHHTFSVSPIRLWLLRSELWPHDRGGSTWHRN